MKYAFAIVAGLALLAAAQAVPVSEDDVYIRQHLRDLMEVVKGRAAEKLEDLKQKRDELLGELKTARDEARATIQKKLQEVSQELKNSYENFLRRLKEILSKKEETYIGAAIAEKIRELRMKASAALKEVAEVIKRQATVAGNEAKEHFEQQKERIFKHLDTLREQITDAIKRNLGGESYTSEEEEEYVIRSIMEALKGKMVEVKGQISSVTEQLKTAAGEKKQELQGKLGELRAELAGCLADIRQAIREIFGKNTYTTEVDYYADDEQVDDLYIVDMVRQLRAKLNEKLDRLKELSEIAKITAQVVAEQAKLGVDAVKREFEILKEDIIREIKDIIKTY